MGESIQLKRSWNLPYFYSMRVFMTCSDDCYRLGQFIKVVRIVWSEQQQMAPLTLLICVEHRLSGINKGPNMNPSW